jgi:hypothetical protein
MRWFVTCLVVVGCGSKPAPRQPPAIEQPVTGVASIAGDWVTDDDEDELASSYALVIARDGKLTRTVDRGKLPRCEQVGTLSAAEGERKFTLVLTKNTCGEGVAGSGVVRVGVSSFTGDRLGVWFGDDAGLGVEFQTYERRPQ